MFTNIFESQGRQSSFAGSTILSPSTSSPNTVKDQAAPHVGTQQTPTRTRQGKLFAVDLVTVTGLIFTSITSWGSQVWLLMGVNCKDDFLYPCEYLLDCTSPAMPIQTGYCITAPFCKFLRGDGSSKDLRPGIRKPSQLQ